MRYGAEAREKRANGDHHDRRDGNLAQVDSAMHRGHADLGGDGENLPLDDDHDVAGKEEGSQVEKARTGC